MAAKKITIKKATVKKKPIKRDDVLKASERIYKLRDAIYKKFNNRWENYYGRDQFKKAINALNTAGSEIRNLY